ncbi:hypothetical protein [Coleofasciculus sp. FACHB-T130]|uniref:hypothetical protein n=1 Tax=Cyanophyceae TaxID=3028117 RepID=UPI001684FC09|nr:hypothetical protein [Coleofasciculus sp. FACHB-T130]MBD1878303.1 hypothetical protein [Coleofasciculus sp. FACHB-T130]
MKTIWSQNLVSISIKIFYKGVFIISLFLLLNLLFYQFIQAYSVSIHFNGSPINGSFQIFNPLRRIGEGQTPGRDFQFFHGLGTLYLHYLPYVLLGKNLFSSEIARYLISMWLFTFTNYLFLRSTKIPKELSLLISIAITYSSDFLGLNSLLYPENSLLGVRSSMPIITGAILIYIRTNLFKENKRSTYSFYTFEIVTSCVVAICFFMSTEHGMAALVSASIMFVAFPVWEKSFSQRLRSLSFFIIFYSLSVLCIYVLLCGYNFYLPLKYSLIDIPTDQFWYFGSPPSPFLKSIYEVNSLVCYRIYIAFFLLIISAILYFVSSEIKKPKFSIILFLIIYGIASNISYLGIAIIEYSTPLYRLEILITIYYCLEAFKSVFSINKTIQTLHHALNSLLLLSLIILIIRLIFNFNLYNPISQLQLLITNSQQITSNKVLGVYLSPSWVETQKIAKNVIGRLSSSPAILLSSPLSDKNWINGISRFAPGFFVSDISELVNIRPGDIATFTKSGSRTITAINGDQVYVEGTKLDPVADGYPHPIQIQRNPETPKINSFDIWSTYSGLLEAEYGVFHPESDYIIHALGIHARKKYVDTFIATKPKFVTTIRSKFTLYEQ